MRGCDAPMAVPPGRQRGSGPTRRGGWGRDAARRGAHSKGKCNGKTEGEKNDEQTREQALGGTTRRGPENKKKKKNRPSGQEGQQENVGWDRAAESSSRGTAAATSTGSRGGDGDVGWERDVDCSDLGTAAATSTGRRGGMGTACGHRRVAPLGHWSPTPPPPPSPCPSQQQVRRRNRSRRYHFWMYTGAPSLPLFRSVR